MTRVLHLPGDQTRLKTAVLSVVRTPALRNDVEVSREDYRGSVTVTAQPYISGSSELLFDFAESLAGYGSVQIGELARRLDGEHLRAVARAWLVLAGEQVEEEVA